MSAQFRRRSRSRARSRVRSRSRVRNNRPLFNGQRRKEVRVLKSENILGITVSDNANGYTYIRRIRPESTCAKMHNDLHIGDQIETINGESMLNKRHFQVARLLRNIPVGQFIRFGLISSEVEKALPAAPIRLALKAPNSNPLGVRSRPIVELSPSDQGPLIVEVTEEEPKKDENEPSAEVIEGINKIFEEYMGFDDDELAKSIYRIGKESKNLADMKARLKEFEFSDDTIFAIWEHCLH